MARAFPMGLAFLLGAMVVLAAVAGEGDGDRFRRGTEALSEGRYREAIGLLEGVRLDGEEEIERLYWLGVARWNREQGEPAIRAYRAAVAIDREGRSDWSLYALENLAEVYTRTDRPRESRQAYRRALAREVRPEWLEVIRNQLAELDLTLGEYAADEHTRFNDRGEILGGVGPGRMRTNRNFEIARHTNDPRKEEKYYRLAAETDPGMHQAPFNAGLALVRQGRHRDAIPWLERSDAVWKADRVNNPTGADKSDAHAFLALSYLELGDAARAARHADRALAAGGADFWALLYAQRTKVARGHAAAALPALRGLAAENPDHGEALHALSEALAAVGRTAESRQVLQAAVDAVPPDHPWMGSLRRRWERSLREPSTP